MTLKMSSDEKWAEIGKNIIDEICTRVDIDDLPWDGGDFDHVEFVKRYKEWKEKAEKWDIHGINGCQTVWSEKLKIEQENKQLKVYKARYKQLEDRYLHGTEKQFGEALTLYFEDEPHPTKEERDA